MLVYEGTKNTFLDDVVADIITDRIYEEYQKRFGRTNQGQIRAWKNSMEYMYKVLIDDEIPNDSGVAIEYNILGTGKRIDFVLSGYNDSKDPSAIILELKQWERCKALDKKDGLVEAKVETFVGGGEREVTHPSYQAWSYASLMQDFNEAIQEENVDLEPCAYLHNYTISDNDQLVGPPYKKYIEKAPIFGKGEVLKLRNFIKKYIKKGDDKKVLYLIESGAIKPSKRLQDVLDKMLSGNQEFVMIDEQKLVLEEVLQLAQKCKEDNKKRVLVVNGGPGTGKSVLAVNLLVKLTNQDFFVSYVTKNSAPRNVYFYKLKGKSTMGVSVKDLFKSSGSFIETPKNIYDVLLIDEAHRLNAKSGVYKNKGENQIKEIIHASKLSVFFLDEDQKVTLSDIGSIDVIEKYVKEYNAQLKTMDLTSQFRCNGSDGYLSWLDNLLEIRQTANYDLDFDYDFRVIDDPNQLRKMVVEKNSINNKSRIVAGYCWNWATEGKNSNDVCDINIPEYNFGMSWNLGNSNTWAIDENSIDQAGCIHTCQGLEFDYVGVIIGDDIRYENGHIVTDFEKRARTDQSIKGLKKLYKENPDEALKIADKLIKNTYRTLMTRGMKGCYIFCVDENLQKYFKEKMIEKRTQ